MEAPTGGWVGLLPFQTRELRLCLSCTPQAPSCPSAPGVAGPQWSTQVTPGELCAVQPPPLGQSPPHPHLPSCPPSAHRPVWLPLTFWETDSQPLAAHLDTERGVCGPAHTLSPGDTAAAVTVTVRIFDACMFPLGVEVLGHAGDVCAASRVTHCWTVSEVAACHTPGVWGTPGVRGMPLAHTGHTGQAPASLTCGAGSVFVSLCSFFTLFFRVRAFPGGSTDRPTTESGPGRGRRVLVVAALACWGPLLQASRRLPRKSVQC